MAKGDKKRAWGPPWGPKESLGAALGNLLETFWDPLESLRGSLERQVALQAEL